MPSRWWVVPGIAAAAVVLAACGTAGSPPSSGTNANAGVGSVTIKTMSTSKGTVLTNAAGMTLYWFGKDTPTASNCTGSCASYWPPLLGNSATISGATLPHGFGTIKRSNGQVQITYDGHPLYTYKGDTTVGQISGNGLTLSGGLWWAMTPSGAELGTVASSTGGTSGSGSSASGSSSSGSIENGGW